MLGIFKNNKVVAEKNIDIFKKLDGGSKLTFCDKCKKQVQMKKDSFDNFIKNNLIAEI